MFNSPTDVTVTGCTFADNHISIALFGRDADPTFLLSTFNVQSNTFTGLGVEAPFPTVGVWVSFGAAGTVSANSFTEFIHNGVENNAVAIVAQDGLAVEHGQFVALRPVVYSGNTFSNNSIHLLAHAANNSKITNNVFGPLAQGALEPALLVSGLNVVIADNNFADSEGAIQLFGPGDTAYGVPRGTARNVILTGNWFTNVTTTVRTNEQVTFQESDSQLCCFQPSFQSFKLAGNGAAQASIRAWQGDSIVVESSST